MTSTHDLVFHDYSSGRELYEALPGTHIESPEESAEHIATAHINTRSVAHYLERVLGIQGVDNNNCPYILNVNCRLQSNGSQEWRNAMWIGGVKNQVVYGQRLVDGSLLSYGISETIVAHEVFHGVTSFSAKLIGSGMPGALNESLSDIFAVLFANRDNKDIGSWNWEIGRPFGVDGSSMRTLNNVPLNSLLPNHMDNYLTMSDDRGGIHYNNAIHNLAVYNLINIRDKENKYVFDAESLTQMFYEVLWNIGELATFLESRNAILSIVSEMFDDSRQLFILNRVNEAFYDVGITESHFNSHEYKYDARSGIYIT